MDSKSTAIIIGGGAAGFFGAIAIAQNHPQMQVILLEKTNVVLAKVRISGGGRCNVTHACFDPKELIKNYPRGGKALLGPFHRFQPRDTICWFEERGVPLKTEEDGRMFPTTDSSETIIHCLQKEAARLGVEVLLTQRVESIEKKEELFELKIGDKILRCSALLLATGSSPQGTEFAKAMGHTLIPPVPSLFTFNIGAFSLADLAGISVEEAQVKIEGTTLHQKGPLLITHWGFSGPAALKLSAWGARHLHACNYRATLLVNWLPSRSFEELKTHLLTYKQQNGSQTLLRPAVDLPKNLWKRLLEHLDLSPQKKWSEISHKDIQRLVDKLLNDPYPIEGKTTYKQEFVTCGGIDLDEVNFKTLQSRKCPGLYFAGEVLDIDGVTGGFNFQNAWTTAWIAGHLET